MNGTVKRVILIAFMAVFYSGVSAQSMWWVDSNKEYIRKTSDSTYRHLDSEANPNNYFKIINNKFWELIGESYEYKGYCTYADDEYTYYDRYDNIVASYVPSQRRYYMHSSQGHTILKSESFAVLSNGVLIQNTGGDIPLKYKVDEGFAPVVIGFFLLVY